MSLVSFIYGKISFFFFFWIKFIKFAGILFLFPIETYFIRDIFFCLFIKNIFFFILYSLHLTLGELNINCEDLADRRMMNRRFHFPAYDDSGFNHYDENFGVYQAPNAYNDIYGKMLNDISVRNHGII